MQIYKQRMCVEKKNHKRIDDVACSLLRSFTSGKFIANTLDFYLSVCTEFFWVALVELVKLQRVNKNFTIIFFFHNAH